MSRSYFVYILSSKSRTLYTGVTNHIERRMLEHKSKTGSRFASRYNVTELVYVEETDDVLAAIGREKQIKSWTRAKKIALIESENPKWLDVSADWFARER